MKLRVWYTTSKEESLEIDVDHDMDTHMIDDLALQKLTEKFPPQEFSDDPWESGCWSDKNDTIITLGSITQE